MKKVIAILAVAFCFTASTAMAQGGGQRMSPEERIAAMKEQLKPLNLTAVQTDSVVAIMTDRSAMGNMREMSQEQRQEAMKNWMEARNKRMEKALGADLAKKVMETLPQRGPGGRGGGGGRPNGK
jgi:hypothetical protein